MFAAVRNLNRDRPHILTALLQLAALVVIGRGDAAEPRVTDGRYKLVQIAKEPDIVTPIGVAFDRQGRLLVVESHTHQRPKDYQGPAGDRIRMLSGSKNDVHLDHLSTFAEGFRHAMNLLVRDDGAVYLVTRHSVVLLRDTNNDGVADKQTEILRLETKDDYPHNGLSGIALQPGGGSLLVSIGENHGIAYRLVGPDGVVLSGNDGAGTIFQCLPDGRGLARVAVGFWNPFSLCVVPDGRVFAVDNDPDASPPCRMLHVVPGGDYGFRFEYGRAGTHPLQAWNGELPGTLPMVIGVGEAPTAIVTHAGSLWVTSWGDHRIERYQLVPRGASYGAKRDVIVQGGADFRPTGMAIAPDGSLYFADWVLRDYPVHGRGRIWRLVLPKEDLTKSFPPPSSDDLAAQRDTSPDSVPSVSSNDPFVQARAAWKLTRRDALEQVETPTVSDVRYRMPDSVNLAYLESQRWRDTRQVGQPEAILREALKSGSPAIRLFAVRWIADERITALRDDVARLLAGPQPDSRYYLAVLGAIDWLDHKPGLRGPEIADDLLVRELKTAARPPEAMVLALALLKPDSKFLTIDRLHEYLKSKHLPLRLEAVRSLAQQTNSKRFELLAAVAQDDSQSDDVRAEAVVGLSAAAEENRDLFEKLAGGNCDVLRREAERALRLAGLRPAAAEAKPQTDDIAAWTKLLKPAGDAAAGRRLFFCPVGARCSVCHKHGGRGGNVGPDLTQIGRGSSREKIITSLLLPSQEIAPDYQPWILTTSEGKTYAGLRLPKPGDDGQEVYADAAGKTFTLSSAAIEERHVAGTSIMPENLQSALSIADLRDLVTFLAESSNSP